MSPYPPRLERLRERIEILGEDPYGPEGDGLSLPSLVMLARAIGVVLVGLLWLGIEHFRLEWPLVLVGGGLLFLGIALVTHGPCRRRAYRQGRALFLKEILLLVKERVTWELPAPSIDAYSLHPEWVQLYVDCDDRPYPCLAVPTPAPSTQRRVVAWLEQRSVPPLGE